MKILKLFEDKDWLYQKYVSEDLSMHKIAKICGTSYGVIWNRMVKYNIPRRTISEAIRGERNPMYGKIVIRSEESKNKQSITMMGEGNHRYGKLFPHSEEFKKRQSIRMSGKNNPMFGERGRKHPSFGKSVIHSEETKIKISATKQGIPFEEWKEYTSFLPYCSAFNEKKKEETRNRDNRVCQMPGCGKSEILNGQRLSVHHIDGDKMQGCNSHWYLAALCSSCNSKPDTIEKEFLIVTNL